MNAVITALTLLVHGALVYQTQAYEISTLYLTACAGRSIKSEATQCPPPSIMILQSITVFASTDSTAIEGAGQGCLQISQCKRVIHNEGDSGLSPSYQHLFQWFRSQCEGRRVCSEGVLPQWWELVGDIKDDAGDTRNCPEAGTKYFTAVLVHFQCFVGGDVSTVSAPPETSPLTRPTTPTTTTAFAVFIPIYLPGLEDREKIILGLAIGLAIAILIVLLVILYCCERYRRHRSLAKLMRMLGSPQAQDNEHEDYSKKETWTDDHINPDALGEYTGVKPDEFLTMTKQAMMNTGQIMYDSAFGTMTMSKRNSCSTLSRDNGFNRFPSIENGASGGYLGPALYDTEENMELERRMAAVLAEDEDDDSVTNASTPQESATIADLTHATSDTDFRHTMANIDLENTANTDLEGANAITNESYEI